MRRVARGDAQVNSQELLRKALWALSVLLASPVVALGQNDPAADIAMRGNGEGSLPSFSETTADQSQGAGCCDVGFGQSCCSRWTASADFIIVERVGSFNQTLVETVPGTVPVKDLYNAPGTEVLNATDLHQGFSGGPRLDLIHHGDNDGDLEVLYFQIDGWNAARSIGPDPTDWLVMKAPGGFVQTQDDKGTQMMAWDYTSRLYNAEVNARWNPWRRVIVLAGFRWVNLSEELQGTLPPERTVPFWDTQTKNNLYGFQIGAEGKLLERGRFSISCMGKAGLFDDHAEETTAVSIYRILFGDSAGTDRAAFVGETGVQCTYQVTQQLSLRAGYEAIWLQGVALAPGQIPDTYSHSSLDLTKIYVQAAGVNCSSGVFYHGATVGLEYAF
jgi:hypothetical protein